MKLPLRPAALFLSVVLLVHAAIAACRTLQNFDLGWQLAAGKHFIETWQAPRGDIFSYTAEGKAWTYPPGAGRLFYLLYLLAGYPALNWLSILTCVVTVALILCAGAPPGEASPGAGPLGMLGALLMAALAVPAIAMRSGVRADMFTTLLYAATLCLLWRWRSSQWAPPYLLPVLFVVWANLHQGFIFGLALFAPFILASLSNREYLPGPRIVIMWFLACALAVLVNPFGWRLYESLLTVQRDLEFQRGFIAEASPLPLGWWRFGELLRLGDPDSGFWVLAALGAIGAVLAIRQRRADAALLLAGALFLGLRFSRAQALLVITVAVVLPALLRELRVPEPQTATRYLAAGAVAVFGVLVVFHSVSFATNRYYVARGDISQFGFGVSWWFPERALNFIAREKLPARLYNDYNLGGWAMWRLWPRYQVYIDGRMSPFSPDVFLEQLALPAAGEDEWRAFLDSRKINTLLISLARFGGHRLSAALLCASNEFRLVYMDEVSGVWLRNRPENGPWLDRLGRPCPAEPFPATAKSDIERYNLLANAGQIYSVLGRDGDALRAFAEAEKIFSEDAALRLTVAQIWQRQGRAGEARQELGNSLAQRETSQAWYALGMLETEQGNPAASAEAFERAAERAVLPHASHWMAGRAYLDLRQPQKALAAFEKARATSRYRGAAAALGRPFLEEVERGRVRAEEMLRR